MKTLESISWEDAQTFLAVAESGSFSGAAQRLNVGQPAVSRRVRDLEHRLNRQLFVRGKFGAELTESAHRILPAAQQMAKWAAEFDHAARDVSGVTSGRVKIACPPGVAVEQMAPFAMWLAQRHQGIRLEILSGIDHVDLTRGTADIAIRTNYPVEPELTVLHEFISQPAVYGASEYVGKLKQPCDWRDLDWVTWSDRYRHVAPRPMLEKVIPDFLPVLTSDDYLVQKSAVRAGLGVMVCSEDEGLEPVDVGVKLPEAPFYIVCAKSMQQVPLIQKVVTLMVANFPESVQTENKKS